MHIFLDTKDLIDLVRGRGRISVSRLKQFLDGHGAKLVLTPTVAFELAAPLLNGGDILSVRRQVRDLEGLPLAYLRGGVVGDELRAASAAYRSSGPVGSFGPFVDRLDKAFGCRWTEEIVSYGLFDFLFDTSRREPALRGLLASYTKPYRPFMDDPILRRRVSVRDGKTDELVFTRVVAASLRDYSVESPRPIQDFARWLRDDPQRCPALRLQYEVSQELWSNVGDTVGKGDAVDLTSIWAIPYVDKATLDARMANYCRGAAGRLRRKYKCSDYGSRLFRNLGAILDST